MLKKIRDLNTGWILIIMGIGTIIFGFSKKANKEGQTLLCFDEGCIYIQAMSNIGIGLLFRFFRFYLIINRK